MRGSHMTRYGSDEEGARDQKELRNEDSSEAGANQRRDDRTEGALADAVMGNIIREE